MKNKEQALAICADILKTLNSRKYSPGTYGSMEIEKKALEGVTDLQQIITQAEATCDVCMKGSLLLSKAKLYDQVPISGIYQYDSKNDDDPYTNLEISGNLCDAALSTIFDKLTIDMMENAFEHDLVNDDGYEYLSSYSDTTSEERPSEEYLDALLRGAKEFGDDVNDASYDAGIKDDTEQTIARVRAVAENVIANEGVFIVEPLYEDDDYDDDFPDDDDDDEEEDDGVLTPSAVSVEEQRAVNAAEVAAERG